MKKSARRISVLLVLVLMLSLFAACGKTEEPEKPSEPPASDAPANNETPEATPDEAPSGEEKTIVFNGPDEWVLSQLQTEKGGYDKVVEKFEKENPGVKVKLTSEPWGSWGQKLPVVITSGDAPDVFMANGADVPSFYNGGYAADLSDMDSAFLDDFYPGAIGQYQDGGAVMALPFTTDCRVLWYNKEIFEAAGLDPEAPPTTWDELVEYAKICSEVTIDGQSVYGFGMDLGLKYPPAASLLCASDWDLFDAAGEPNVDNEIFRKYLDVVTDMSGTYEPDYATLNHENVATLFGQKKVAMVVAGAWIWSLNDGLADEDWYGMAATPKMDESAPDGSFAGGWAICVSSSSENLAEAKKFAQALFDAETAYTLHTDVPPFNAGADKCELFQNPRAQVFVENMKYGRQYMPPSEYATEFNNLLWEEVGKVVMGKQDNDECIAAIEKGIKDIID